ncbi:hypothetical protein [Lapidilactobacillus luobeiensis]|uniref:hypothetical protein n=1 Tax=Lapidilactobacillus luobeiensis TaxID=2950371 RepID=UPI0021C2DF37|nr:hypothetical protein [Lapidilactobacillus luobeiensis]
MINQIHAASVLSYNNGLLAAEIVCNERCLQISKRISDGENVSPEDWAIMNAFHEVIAAIGAKERDYEEEAKEYGHN